MIAQIQIFIKGNNVWWYYKGLAKQRGCVLEVTILIGVFQCAYFDTEDFRLGSLGGSTLALWNASDTPVPE